MSRLALILSLAFMFAGCSAHRDEAAGTRLTPLGASSDDKLANLKRAAQYPWKDDGRCAVQASSEKWATLVERCFDALDLSRIRFVDHKGVCSMAQAGTITADQAIRMVGICLLVQPELAVGAVLVIGVAAIAFAIVAEIEAVERARKPGCRCYCLKQGESPYTEFGRVASPGECATLCRNLKRGYTGSVCK